MFMIKMRFALFLFHLNLIETKHELGFYLYHPNFGFIQLYFKVKVWSYKFYKIIQNLLF